MKCIAQLIAHFWDSGELSYEEMIHLRDNNFPVPSNFIPWDDDRVSLAVEGKP